MEVSRKNEKEAYPDGVEQVFKEHRMKRYAQEYKKAKPGLLKLGILSGVLFVLVLFYFLPASRVRSVSIQGNYYLDRSYIMQLSGVTLKDRFYLTLPMQVERRLERDAMIEDAKVTLQSGNVISIEVKEKQPVGYRYEDEPVILFSDNTKTQLKSDYLEIIASLPFIIGFEEDEDTRLLVKALNEVDPVMIEDIAEISEFALSYDPQAIKILMRNGGYFISDFYNLDKINLYNGVYSQLKDKNNCIYATISTNKVSAWACPWDEENIELEYWRDEDGEIITNIYGDPAAKHYYKDAEGEDAVDREGNPIVIPIGEDGLDIYDEHFQEHYEAGYYDSGELILPDSEE